MAQKPDEIDLPALLAEFAAHEKQHEPPVWAVGNAEKIFRLKKPGSVTISKEIVANLIYDSFNDPMPIGIRKRDLPARQMLYAAEGVQLDLKIEVSDERGLIIGQIVAEKGDLGVGGLQIDLTEHGRVMDTVTTNALGEFVFEGLPKGNYELQIVLCGTMVKLPSFRLNN